MKARAACLNEVPSLVRQWLVPAVGRATPDTPAWVERTFTMKDPQGLHARPAAMFVNTANRFEAEIAVTHEHQTVQGKSILSIMTLCVMPGDELVVSAQGPDAEQAMKALACLFEASFSTRTIPTPSPLAKNTIHACA